MKQGADLNENPHDHTDRSAASGPLNFWRSRAGMYLIVAVVIGGLLLGYEHRVHILGSDWLLWVPLLICVVMHFFMHGGHGSGGGRS